MNNSKQYLDHYTLSVCLMSQLFYTYDYMTFIEIIAERFGS